MKKREELKQEVQWDLSDYFKDEKEWNKEYDSLKKHLGSFKKFENKLNNKQSILECLKKQTEIDIRLEALYVWANLRSSEDATNNSHEQKLNKVQSLATSLNVETSFIHVEISNNEVSFLKELEKDQDFKDYSIYFYEILRHKPHILSKEEEAILEQTTEFAFGYLNVFNKFNDADIKFENVKDSKGKKHDLNHSNYSGLLESNDRELRKNTMISLHSSYKKFNNTLSANYISNIKRNCTYAKIKKHKSAIERSIFNEDANIKVYKNLISSVRKNLDVFHRYFELKRKTLKYSKYAVWDNFSSISEKNGIKLSYKEAIELIKKACEPLGQEYLSLLDKAVSERWIDYGINEGKDSGAFSTGAYGKKPVVLISYEKETHSIFTLAHELGHALHTYYSNTSQPYNKAGYVIFVAEVASNVNEMLLLFHLLDKATDKEEKLFLIDKFMSNFRGSVFRQTMFAEFEEFCHTQYEKDLPISAEILNNKYLELNQEYFGKDVELFDELTYEWSRIPHFYNAFYVYKYATGLICAITITKNILANKKNAIEDYIKFLSSGCSLPPIELLKNAGTNLEQPKTIDESFAFATEMLNEWEKQIK